MKLFAVILAVLLTNGFAWHACDGGGICPNGNDCCSTSDHHRSSCISGKEGEPSSCCVDDEEEGSTGCGNGFSCAREKGKGYCQREDPADETLPDRVPRYKLCSLPDPVLKQVHGFPVTTNADDPKLAYLSTMGAIDSGDPKIIQRHEKVETLLIVVHGSSRNVDDYICCTNSALPAAEQDPASSTIMVVAPWFAAPEDGDIDITESGQPLYFSDLGPTEPEVIFHTWRYGADAMNAPISSYMTIDAIVNRVLSDLVRYPSLKRIVLAGHSAGGQFAQRWALLSNSQAFANVTYTPRVPTRVVVANPKSFAWLDARRYINGSLRIPDTDEIDKCPMYNEWEWGLDEGSGFLAVPYKDRAIQEAGNVDQIVERYPSRDIVYLAGEMDVLPNGQCFARMQGEYRRIRSEHFMAALEDIYGRPVHRRLVVSSVHHDHCLMFQSPAGREAMFGSVLGGRRDDLTE